VLSELCESVKFWGKIFYFDDFLLFWNIIHSMNGSAAFAREIGRGREDLYSDVRPGNLTARSAISRHLWTSPREVKCQV